MSMLIPNETPYGKELWKWDHFEDESHPADASIRGMKPRGYLAYPAMVYRMTAKNPWKWESHIVKDEHEQRNFESRGFVAGGPQAAADAYDAAQARLALAAAERNYDDRHLSDRAKAEAEAAQSASARHLGAIPETPIKRRGRPRKDAEPVAAA